TAPHFPAEQDDRFTPRAPPALQRRSAMRSRLLRHGMRRGALPLVAVLGCLPPGAPKTRDGGASLFPLPGVQSELGIAADETGQHVVVAYIDFRGFSLNPVSLTAFAYSDDGGQTFTEGGALPTPGRDALGDERFPQTFGDPDVKYLGGCSFVL